MYNLYRHLLRLGTVPFIFVEGLWPVEAKDGGNRFGKLGGQFKGVLS